MATGFDANLQRYQGILRRWWGVLSAGFVLPVMVSGLLLLGQPHTYRARVAVLVGSPLQALVPDWSTSQASASLALTYADLARRPLIMQAVIDDLHLRLQPQQLAGQVTTLVQPDSQVVEINVVDTNPRTAQAIANSIAQALVRQTASGRQSTDAQMTFSAQQLEQLQGTIKGLQDRLTALQASMPQRTSPEDLENAQREVAALSNMLSTERSTYADLLSFYRQGLGASSVNVVEPAAPAVPVGRRSPLMLAAAGLAGLVVATGGVSLAERLEDALHWEGPAQRTSLDLPILGAIGALPGGSSPLFYLQDPHSRDAEALRRLRANIYLALPGDEPRSLLITSPGRQDGKSLLAANLAAAVAAAGTEVALVDANLREPVLHELLHVRAGSGLADLLLDKGPLAGDALQDIVQPTAQHRLWLLRAGRRPMDATGTLLSPRLPELLGLLKQRYPVIVVDGPAETVGPDAGILASLTDSTVLVVREGWTQRQQALRSREAIERHAGHKTIGLVFDQVPQSGGSPPIAPARPPEPAGQAHSPRPPEPGQEQAGK